jgi:hypothetical protein
LKKNNEKWCFICQQSCLIQPIDFWIEGWQKFFNRFFAQFCQNISHFLRSKMAWK